MAPPLGIVSPVAGWSSSGGRSVHGCQEGCGPRLTDDGLTSALSRTRRRGLASNGPPLNSRAGVGAERRTVDRSRIGELVSSCRRRPRRGESQHAGPRDRSVMIGMASNDRGDTPTPLLVS